jgi:hypothetical protein
MDQGLPAWPVSFGQKKSPDRRSSGHGQMPPPSVYGRPGLASLSPRVRWEQRLNASGKKQTACQLQPKLQLARLLPGSQLDERSSMVLALVPD